MPWGCTVFELNPKHGSLYPSNHETHLPVERRTCGATNWCIGAMAGTGRSPSHRGVGGGFRVIPGIQGYPAKMFKPYVADTLSSLNVCLKALIAEFHRSVACYWPPQVVDANSKVQK